MPSWGDVGRILAPIKRKLFLLVGRSILAAINDSEKTQKLQLKLLADEIATDVERFENYGLSSYPWEDAEALATFINGNRDHGIVIVVHDRRYRPDYLTQGEVVVFTDEDKTEAFRVHLKRNRILNLKCTDLDVDVTDCETKDITKDLTHNIGEDQSVTIGGAKTEAVTGIKTVSAASETITLDTSQETTCGTTFTIIIGSQEMIYADSSNVMLGDNVIGSLRRLVDERLVTLFNNHVHGGVTSGGANSGVPTTSASTANHCTDTARAK